MCGVCVRVLACVGIRVCMCVFVRAWASVHGHPWMHVYMYACMSNVCSLQRYSEADCTISGKEWNLILGETDAERTEKLPV